MHQLNLLIVLNKDTYFFLIIFALNTYHLFLLKWSSFDIILCLNSLYPILIQEICNHNIIFFYMTVQ